MKIGILGCGKTGLSAIDYFTQKGYEIFVKDDKNPPQVYQEIQSVRDLDLLFISPGLPNNKIQRHPLIEEALKLGIKITSDIEILLEKEKNATFIAITGTNGKSTTTALIGHLLQSVSKEKIAVGGNIGIPVLSLEKADIYVLELSSFQLDLLPSCPLTTGLFLNLTPDHLDSYLDLLDYRDSKAKILQSNNSIISADYPILEPLLPGQILFSRKKLLNPGLSLIHNSLTLQNLFGIEKIELELITPSLPGPYNAENIMGALLAAMTLGHSLESLIPHLSSFRGLPHRLETVLERESCIFINDSKATNAISTRAALEAFSDKKILLIAGGFCKDEGIIALRDLFPLMKKVLLIGESGEKFYDILKNDGVPAEISGTLEEALTSLKEPWKDFDLVLLSPAAASTDQWKNFEERGNYFKNRVLELFSKD